MSLESDLESILGAKGWIASADSEPWRRDWLNKFGETPLGVARPKSTSEVSKIMALCFAAQVPVVPQGGNTSLTGAAVLSVKGGVILSLSRLNSIEDSDVAGGTIVVGAGVVLSRLHQKLEGSGFMFPMHIGAEGTAQIGGLIATNAGGSHAFRYGMMQDLVFGLEVVLPDGRVWNGMRRVQKDNAGYQLRKIFCGAEGTLGIVTKAVLKLSPEPVQQVTAFLAVATMEAAYRLTTLFRAKAGDFLNALEFVSDTGLGMALDNIPDITFPLKQRAPFYLLIEAGTGSLQVPLEEILSGIMETGIEEGHIIDGVLAMSKAQRDSLWRIREEQPEGQRLEGAQLKHDISVPPAYLKKFLDLASAECQSILDGVRINPFGHLGDGNVHYNLSTPVGQEEFFGLDEKFAIRLGRLASELFGSFAAEHGLGHAKVSQADTLRDPLERQLMMNLKLTFDPNGLLNPGVIVSSKIVT